MEQKVVTFTPNPNSAVNKPDCGYGHACSFCKEEATCTRDKSNHNKQLSEARLAQIGQIIIVLANKGGVGKSTVAANLAAGLARRGFRVGLGDADIHGPNAAQFFGQQGERVKITARGIRPRRYRSPDQQSEVRIGSPGFFLPETDAPVVWRDAYKFDYIHHLVGSYDWGELDFWVIDMPPGTGNELITLCDILEGSNLSAVLVTTPQAVALLDSLKAARFCRERGVPVLGMVENMAGMACPHCGNEIQLFPRDPMADSLHEAGIKTLAQLPLSPQLAFASDAGGPIVDQAPDSIEASAFMTLAEACIDKAARDESQLMEQQLAAVLDAPEQLAAIEEALGNEPEAAALRDQIQSVLQQEQARFKQL